MKKLLFAACLSLLVISCGDKEEEKKEDDSSKIKTEMHALYEKNLATLKTVYSAFEKEDIDALASHVADNTEWNGPSYGDTVKTKAHWMEGLKYYVTYWDNLKFNNAMYLPGVDSLTHEMDGGVRVYGRWDGMHKSGVATHVNYYGAFRFNKDGKISAANEFFDVGGLMNAVAPKSK